MTDEKVIILKPSNNIINGVIPIQIENVSDIIRNIDFSSTYFICTLAFKFNFPFTNLNYPNDTWKVAKFDGITQNGTFWIKLPLFLFSYSFHFKMGMDFRKYDENEMTQTDTLKSTQYSLTIPSILLDNKDFSIGDDVMYEPKDAAYAKGGKITKFLTNDMIEIMTNPEYRTIHDPPIVSIPKQSVFSIPICKTYVADLTNSIQACNDLVLRNNRNEAEFDVFSELHDVLLDIYFESYTKQEINYGQSDAVGIPNFVAVHIYEFLFDKKYNYRINCVFDDTELFYQRLWPFHIGKTLTNTQNGVNTQNVWDCMGYSCDICRVEVRYFEYMWNCTNPDQYHGYCLSCTYSMVQQHDEMQDFLEEILDGVINRDCIEEIVVFCVGKINKFRI